jgi:hypothetical protein
LERNIANALNGNIAVEFNRMTDIREKTAEPAEQNPCLC